MERAMARSPFWSFLHKGNCGNLAILTHIVGVRQRRQLVLCHGCSVLPVKLRKDVTGQRMILGGTVGTKSTPIATLKDFHYILGFHT